MALLRIDIVSFLACAKGCDRISSDKDAASNPAALLTLMWQHATDEIGILLPYKDRSYSSFRNTFSS